MAVKHSSETAISRVSQKTDSAILFYSGGKDSLALLDLMAPNFNRIICVFMYFVKGLAHVQPYLTHAAGYGNTEIMEVPHYMLTHIYREGVYCLPNSSMPVKRLKHVDEEARKRTGIEWSFYGMKQVDSLQRRLMLRGYENETICLPTQKAYPLSKWGKQDVLAYLKAKRLPVPISYGQGKQSAGLSFDPAVLAWLRDRHPDDLEKIYRAFPMSRQILSNEQKD